MTTEVTPDLEVEFHGSGSVEVEPLATEADAQQAAIERQEREAAIAMIPAKYRTDDPFGVHDVGKAAWVVNLIRSAHEAVARGKEEAKAYIASLEAEEARIKRMFMPGLREWAEQNRHGKNQYAVTPAGRVGFRSKAADFKCKDEAAALAWAQANKPEFVKTIPEQKALDLAGLKKHLKELAKPDEDGEIPEVTLPDGWVTEEAQVTFYVDGVK